MFEAKIDDRTDHALARMLIGILDRNGNTVRHQNTVVLPDFFAPGNPLSISIGGWATQRSLFATRIFIIWSDKGDFFDILERMDIYKPFIHTYDKILIVSHKVATAGYVARKNWCQFNYTEVHMDMWNLNIEFLLSLFRDVVMNDQRKAVGSAEYK